MKKKNQLTTNKKNIQQIKKISRVIVKEREEREEKTDCSLSYSSLLC